MVRLFLLFFLLAGSVGVALALDFGSLAGRSPAYVSTAVGHTYGWSEVPWTYDRFNKKFVRIGGCTGGYTNEVYSYHFDGSGNFISTEILPPGTQGGDNRAGAGCSRGICYDSKRRVVWGLGGIGSPPIPCSGKSWTLMSLDLSNNTWQAAPNGSTNSFGATCQIEYSEYHDAIVMVTDGTGWHQSWIYEFSKSAWRQLGTEWDPTKAGPRQGASMNYREIGYDPEHHVFVMLVGPSSDVQTWVFDPATMSDWEVRRPSVQPPQRERYGMAYDQLNHKLVFHGGWVGAWDNRINMTDTWTYDAAQNVWTKIADLGPSRTDNQTNLTAFDYDAEHNAFVTMNPQAGGVTVYRLGGGSTGITRPALSPAAMSFSLFPNPVLGSARFEIAGSEGAAPSLSILSADGRAIQRLRLVRSSSGYAAEWGTAGFPAGVYYGKLVGGAFSATRKMVVVR